MSISRYVRCHKGSSTIETALIISALLIILATLIYSSFIMYQKVLLAKTAQYIAQQGALIWSDSRKSIYDGAADERKNDMGMLELYYQLMDDSIFTGKRFSGEITLSLNPSAQENPDIQGSQDVKFSKMRRAIEKELSKSPLKPSSTHLEMEFHNILIQRKLRITLVQEIRLPLGGIQEFFNGKNTVTLVGTGEAVITEPEEYIRNTDFIMEYISRSGTIGGIADKIQDLRDKLGGGK